jgi:hypothetical protein|tara:strand:- start:479 stop:1573 length:1095 start_codon:yes stop_codon:yes gene_type:complete
MGDYTKITGVEDHDIVKVVGVSANDIVKVAGVTKSAGGGVPVATKWLAGGAAGKVFTTAEGNAGSNWAEAVDIGTGSGKGIALGEDQDGNKRWVVHRSLSTAEISYANNGLEDDSGNWTTVNLTNDHKAVNGGPSVAWGNDYWVGAGESYDDGDSEVFIFASSNGGSSWSIIDVGNTTNDPGRCVCYKDNTTFFATIADQIWKTTADPTSAGNWSLAIDLDMVSNQDIAAMAYDGHDRWVAVCAGGKAATSTNDWSSATEIDPDVGSSNMYGVVYCAGNVDKWVATAHGGKISYSSDGVNWTAATTPITNALYAIATDHTTIVVVGGNGSVLTSSDAINWTQITTPFSNAVWSVACDVIGAGMR